MDYYSRSLNSARLVKCYEVSPPRIKQFLEAEIQYVLDKVDGGASVLDLGCGYGRVAVRLADKAGNILKKL